MITITAIIVALLAVALAIVFYIKAKHQAKLHQEAEYNQGYAEADGALEHMNTIDVFGYLMNIHNHSVTAAYLNGVIDRMAKENVSICVMNKL